MGVYLGYAIRVATLVLLGGSMAILNSEVAQPLALVQLGAAAPALIAAYINGSAAAPRIKTVSAFSVGIISQAEAKPRSKNVQLAGGWFADVTEGFGKNLGTVAALDQSRQAADKLDWAYKIGKPSDVSIIIQQSPQSIKSPDVNVFAVTDEKSRKCIIVLTPKDKNSVEGSVGSAASVDDGVCPHAATIENLDGVRKK